MKQGADFEQLNAPMIETFKAFRWHSEKAERGTVDAGPVLRFIGRARDVAMGCQTLLEFLEWDDLGVENRPEVTADDSPKQVIGTFARGTLGRLLIVSMDQLNDEADRMTDWISKRVEAQQAGGDQ